jgi:sugar phosphate isomerase/epimerase
MKRPPEGETLFDANARLYKSLIPYAERFGVKIAIENLFLPVSEMERRLPIHADPKEHKSLVMAVESDMACACLDVGHANMVGVDPADSIRTLGREHLGALHIHDNFGLRDLHLLPYTGAIKWDTITDALAEIDYDGDMTLEIVGYVARLPLDMLPEGLRLAESVGRRLIREIEEKRGHKNV